MDSPRPLPHSPTEDSQSELAPSTPSSSKWVRSINPIHRALSVAVLSSLFAALVFSSLPLWRPIAALFVQKLLDFLKFLVVTTGIGLGILNSRLWRSSYTDRESVPGDDGGEEDSRSSKGPFVGIFSSEMQHSYSFDGKEMEASENGSLMSRKEPERDGGGDDENGAADDDERKTWHASVPVTDSTSGVPIKEGIAHERDESLAEDMKEDGAKYEEAAFGTKVKHYDDLGLAGAVAQQPSKIIHRRGISLDFSIEKEWDSSKLGSYAATDQECASKLSSSKLGSYAAATDQQRANKLPSLTIRKSPSSALNMVDHATKVDHGSNNAAESSSKSNAGAGFPAAIPTSTTPRHNRSRSAYDLNELLVQQRPGNKSCTTPSQLSRRRRNGSLSCDLDKEYGTGGAPGWFSALPSPPEPPLVYDYGTKEHRRVETREFDMRQREGQDESSLRKAFSESLAPWRATRNAMPVEVPISSKETKGDFAQWAESPASMRLTPPSSPSTPNSSNTMGSPSPGELNKKVDAFIARFHQQMRLQRLESLERSKQRGH